MLLALQATTRALQLPACCPQLQLLVPLRLPVQVLGLPLLLLQRPVALLVGH
jgi:hypothetical protein